MRTTLAPFLLTLAALAACSSPSPRYRGVVPVTVSMAGHVFDVYAIRGQAQVIRTDRAMMPRKTEIIPAAVRAAEKATGCAVEPSQVKGDAAIVTMDMAC